MIMGRKIGITICFAFLLLLTGCGYNTAQNGENMRHNIRIGVSIYDGYDTLVSEMVSSMDEWAKDKEKESGDTILLDVVSAGGSQLAQNDQVARFIDKGYDAICVNLVDRTDTTVIIDKAKSAGVPVVFFNREPVAEDLNRWDLLYYVGANSEQSGLFQAQIVIDTLYDKSRFAEIDRSGDGVIQYVILEGEIGHQDALIRTQVSIDKIQRAGFAIEKIGDEIANWNRNQAESKMKQLLDVYPTQIEMVIANDDDMALGALDAITSRGAQLPLIVGVNGTDEALEMVKMKKLEGTVYNDARGQADKIMQLAYNLSTGNIKAAAGPTDSRTRYVNYRLVNYDNVQEFIRMNE